MTDKVHPSFNREAARSRETSVAIAHAGGAGDGFIWPASSRLVEDSEGDLASGALNAFGETHSSSSLDVTIGSGEALRRGAYLARDVSTTITLPANSTTTIALGWKDGQADTVLIGEVGTAVGDTFTADDPRKDIWTFTTDGSGVTGTTDERDVTTDPAGGATLTVEDDGTVVADPTSTLDFGGSDFNVTNPTSEEAQVEIGSGAIDTSELDLSISPSWSSRHTFSDGLTATAQIRTGNGSSGAPAYTFLNETGTGMYRPGTSEVAFSVTGSRRVRINANEVIADVPFKAPAGSLSGAAYAFDGDSNTGMFRPGTNQLALAAGGNQILTADATDISVTESIAAIDGSASSPSYMFENETNTGIYRPTTGRMNLVADGVEMASVDDNFFRVFDDLLDSGGRVIYSDTNQHVPREQQQFDEAWTYNPGHTNWEDGLSNEEVARFNLDTGEVMRIERIAFRQKFGGTSSSASVDIIDKSDDTVIGSADLGTRTKDPGSSASGALLLVRLTNSTGSAIDANPLVTGYIEGS